MTDRRALLTRSLVPAYDGGMKHLPEAHQSIVPDRTVALVLAGIVVVMAVIWVVVALAD